MAQNYDSALDEIEIFRDLSAEERASISEMCRWRRAKSGEQIVGHLDRTADVYFVVQGNLRARNYSVTGKEVLFYDVGPGEIFGEFSAIDGEVRSTDIFALKDAFIGSLTSEKFWQIVNKHPQVGALLLRRLTRIIRHLNERIFEFSTLAVNNRIHAELLRLAYSSGVECNQAKIAPSPTHAEIASRVSTNREAVTRELSSMARAGILKKEKRVLVINDVAELHESLAQKLGEFTLNLGA